MTPFPEWVVPMAAILTQDGSVHHPLVTDTRSLVWIANQNTITLHVWTSRAPKLQYPDVCVFDLDPPSTMRRPSARRRFRCARS